MKRESKGSYGWLDLQRMNLPFTTLSRSFPANREEATAGAAKNSENAITKKLEPAAEMDCQVLKDRPRSPKHSVERARDELEDCPAMAKVSRVPGANSWTRACVARTGTHGNPETTTPISGSAIS